MRYKKLNLITKYKQYETLYDFAAANKYIIDNAMDKGYRVYIVVKSITNKQFLIRPIASTKLEKRDADDELIVKIDMYLNTIFRINEQSVNRVMIVYEDGD